jgi:hypothetical protein
VLAVNGAKYAPFVSVPPPASLIVQVIALLLLVTAGQ